MAAQTEKTLRSDRVARDPKPHPAPGSDRWLEEFKSRQIETPTTAQIIFFLDSAGTLRAEMPGINGNPRRKVDIPIQFERRNPELMDILKVELHRVQAERERIRAVPKATYLDPEAERIARNNRIRAEKDAQFNTWLESLPEKQRAHEIEKRNQRLEKARQAELERARSVWSMTNLDHGVDLANAAIPADRRPRRKHLVRGQYVSPQNQAAMDAAARGEKVKRKTSPKKVDPKLVVKISL